MTMVLSWNSRGVGLDGHDGVGCFVCGCTWRDHEARSKGNDYLHNVCAWINKLDEAASLGLFENGGAWMAYYHAERDAPQIKVVACTFHLKELERLSGQWFIDKRHIDDLVRFGLKRLERVINIHAFVDPGRPAVLCKTCHEIAEAPQHQVEMAALLA